MVEPDTGVREIPMQMTPMIDIVFNLVTFFMLTLDLSRKDCPPLDLPHAHMGVEDEPIRAASEGRIVVNLERGGDVVVRGQRFAIASPDVRVQSEALQAFHVLVRTIVATDALEHGRRDHLVVLVRGDRDVPWRRTSWILQSLADPALRVSRVQFAVESPPARPQPVPSPERR